MPKKIEPLEVAKWGIVVVGGIVVYRILRATGLLKSTQEQAQSNLIAENELLVENSELQDWTKANYFQNPPPGFKITYNRPDDLAKWVVNMYNTAGVFDDDEEAMKNLLFRIKTKDTYSQLANIFALTYNKDLTAWLKDNFNVSELSAPFRYLSQLPKFTKK